MQKRLEYFSIACHPVDLTKKNCTFDTQNGAARVSRRLWGVVTMVWTKLDGVHHLIRRALWAPYAQPGLESICGEHSDPIVCHPGLAPLGPPSYSIGSIATPLSSINVLRSVHVGSIPAGDLGGPAVSI